MKVQTNGTETTGLLVDVAELSADRIHNILDSIAIPQTISGEHRARLSKELVPSPRAHIKDKRLATYVEVRRSTVGEPSRRDRVHLNADGPSSKRILVGRAPELPLVPDPIDHLNKARALAPCVQ